jgi:hypothetical protein
MEDQPSKIHLPLTTFGICVSFTRVKILLLEGFEKLNQPSVKLLSNSLPIPEIPRSPPLHAFDRLNLKISNLLLFLTQTNVCWN